VYVVRADGSGLRRLTSSPGDDFDPSLSPDGSMVAFRSRRDGDNEVYVMDADGRDQRDVSRDAADDWGPNWSPDGRVVFNCARGLAIGFRGCAVRPDGSDLRILPIRRYVEYPAWSPDGSKIAFMSQEPDAAGNDPNYDIFVVDADGTGLRQLTDAPGEDGFPAWSPDGTWIAFSSTRDDCANSPGQGCLTTGDIGPYEDVWMMRSDGSDQHRLSARLGQLMSWSPDGAYLVFSPGLNVIRADGSGLTTIAVPVGEPEFANWGP
jgi:TolB protein